MAQRLNSEASKLKREKEWLPYLEHQALLDGVMAENGGGQGAGQQGEDVLALRHLHGGCCMGLVYDDACQDTVSEAPLHTV